MKKLLIITMLSLFTTTLLCSQDKKVRTRPLRVGVKVGFNLSDMNTKDAASTSMIAGINAGFFCKMPITSIFSFRPELYITTKGATVSYNNPIVVGEARFNFTYLEIPLLYVINFGPRFNIHAGPYVSFLLHSKVKNKSDGNAYDFEKNINSTAYNHIDGGVALGTAMDIGGINLGIRYNIGFTEIGKEQTISGMTYRIPNAKNSVINFYLSYYLNGRSSKKHNTDH